MHTRPVISRRTARRAVAIVATLAILAAQSVGTAYACVLGGEIPERAAEAASPCHEVERAAVSTGVDRNLCEVHCQATPLPSPGMIAMAPPPGDALAIPPPLAVAHGLPARAPDAKGTPPPARDRYCRLQL